MSADTSRERIERLKATDSADYIHMALLDRAERSARWRRRMARLHADLSAVAVALSAAFVVLMIVKVVTAGGL